MPLSANDLHCAALDKLLYQSHKCYHPIIHSLTLFSTFILTLQLFTYFLQQESIVVNQAIKIMKNSRLLIKPKSVGQAPEKEGNIFQKARLSSTLPAIKQPLDIEKQQRIYDFVGPTQFRVRRFFSSQSKTKLILQKRNKHQNNDKTLITPQLQTSCEFTRAASTTINRQTLLTKLSKHDQIQASKQKRNISKHKQYQHYWNIQGQNIKQLLNKKRQSLLCDGDKVIVQNNPDKDKLINDNVTHYWQMSLRNNHPLLKRHIKGHRYGDVELEELLQYSAGVKQVEGSIPELPMDALRNVKTKELSLAGRSKSVVESQATTGRNSFAYLSSKDMLNQEQVYRINYEGHKKWQGTEQLY